MKKTSEPIVFFGSGPVAAKSLRLLIPEFHIEAVVTKPRPAHHKGSVPVLELAEKLKIPVKTVENKATLDALIAKRPFGSRLGILIDFGIIVSQKAIDYFSLGIVNSHFSLLPQWRGADPISFSILSGQNQTGVSLMLLVEKMDEGPILAQGVYDLEANETTQSLTTHLVKLSAALLHDSLPKYLSGEITPCSQEAVAAMLTPPPQTSYSRKLTKEDGQLDWSKPAVQLEREIRAFIEWPKSRTTIRGIDIVITKAHVVKTSGRPGTTEVCEKLPIVHCGENALALDRLKPAGKQEMTGEGFLAGYRQVFLGLGS